MNKINKLFWIVSLLAVMLSACAAGAPLLTTTQEAMMDKPEGSADTMMDKPTEAVEMMEKPTETAEMMEKHDDTADAMMEKPTEAAMSDEEPAMEAASGMMETPAWFSIALVEASTGESFSVADFKGKVVLVETLAMWCSNCMKQQKQVMALHGLLGERDDFVSLGLDIDPNENMTDLKAYTESNGFDWTYAVAPAELSRELGNLYGSQFLNPPSTPMLIIDRHGEVHPLPFGIKSAEDLQKALEPFLNEGM